MSEMALSSSELRRKMVPTDGSCLFYSIDYLVTGEERSEASKRLRELCVQRILQDHETYSAVRLGVEYVSEYTEWISNEMNYGGETEILIMAEEYGYEIAVISVESMKVQLLKYSPQLRRIEEENTSVSREERKRIYVIYNGQHYDAIEGIDGQRIFSSKDGEFESEGAAIAFGELVKEKRDRELKTRRRKKIKCGGCGAICSNGTEFQSHCMKIEHDEDFGYECEEIEVTELVENVYDD